MHLALRAVIAAVARAVTVAGAVASAPIRGTARGAAAGAALGVLIAASSMKLLIVRVEHEVRVALDTGQGSVGVIQVFQLSSLSLVGRGTELEDHRMQSNSQS